MTLIELPDQHAAVLRSKAASLGLTLEEWLKSLAENDVRQIGSSPKGRYKLDDLLAQSEDREWLDSPPAGREAI